MAIVIDVTERHIAPSVAAARGVDRILSLIGSDERPAERIARENAEALRLMAELGDGPGAAMKVARRWSDDPHERHNLAQRFRNLRRKKKRIVCV